MRRGEEAKRRGGGAALGSRMLLSLLLALVFASVSHAARPFDGRRAYQDLVKQCKFGPRAPGSRAHERCAQWLVAQLRPLADSVTQQRFTCTVGGRRLGLTNIIATFNPHGQEHVLLAAHWDTRPHADQDPNPARRTRPVPGANDGASGVAVLLEIARALKASPPRQKVTIVLFDGEDYGATPADMFLGSRYFADHYQGPVPNWAVLLDMVGDKDLRLPIEAYSQQRAPQVVQRIWSAAGVAGSTAFVWETGPAIMDDHLPLLDRSIPCINVIDFTYPYWHTTADTPDKCSGSSLAQVGRAVLQALE